MKKNLFIIFMLLFTGLALAANLVINKTDGETLNIPLNDIENISFTSSENSDIETLMSWMTGSFSSQAQADTSSDPYHYDVRLKMARIWSSKPGAYWLYVEQAYAESQNAPYRQRIYRVFEEDGIIQDEIYKIPNQSSYIGAYATPEVFDSLSEEDLILKPNCGLTFIKQDDSSFYGTTDGSSCIAGIPGVEYITSESTITSTYLTSWDLGYNANGVIVMGPYSPYVFDKIEDYPMK